MMSRRLYVVWSSPLFRDSTRLLLNHPDVEWVGATSDYALACAAILSLRPDTILVEKQDNVIPAELMELLATNSFDFQLIGVSVVENRLSIYRHETWAVSAADDLLQLVLQ